MISDNAVAGCFGIYIGAVFGRDTIFGGFTFLNSRMDISLR